jgi:hypothetical protein
MHATAGYGIVMDDGTMKQIAIANDVTLGQLSRAFVQYMTTHPELKNKSALFALTSAARDAGLTSLVPIKKPT